MRLSILIVYFLKKQRVLQTKNIFSKLFHSKKTNGQAPAEKRLTYGHAVAYIIQGLYIGFIGAMQRPYGNTASIKHFNLSLKTEKGDVNYGNARNLRKQHNAFSGQN